MDSNAVIFIPGIKGSKLVETNRAPWDTIWSGVQSNFESIQDLELTSEYKGQFYDVPLETIIKAGEIEELAYGEFLKDLETKKPIYIFNYDWRLSAKENGNRLNTFLDYLTNKSKANKSKASKKSFKRFDFVTHSLGNFILRSYIKNFGFDRIHKIVFTVPPFTGSIDIVQAILVGEGFFTNVKAKIRKLIRTFPGALELLPNYDGAGKFNSGSVKFDYFKLENWQKNVTSPENPYSQKFKETLALAWETVNEGLCDLTKLDKEERSRIMVIARHGYETYQSAKIYKKKDEIVNFIDLEKACRTDDGDGRVPHVSSCHFWKSVDTYMVDDSWLYKDYSHGFVLKDERVQKLVNRFLYPKIDPKTKKIIKFSHKIHGGSVKKVEGLVGGSKKGLPFWKVKLK